MTNRPYVSTMRHMENAEAHRAGLIAAGAKRAQAETLRAQAMAELAIWVRAGKEQGLPIAEIARLAGLTRQTVYTILATHVAA